MKTLQCRPVVTGDFMQPPMCENWSVDDFRQHFDRLKEAGIDTFILQWAGEMECGGIRRIHHKSTSLSQDTAHHLEDYHEYSDMLGNLLKAADEKQMHVFIGLPMITGQEWWDLKFKDAAWRELYCNYTAAFAEEIYNTYYETYQNVISGFYWCQEMFTNRIGLEKYWALMLNKDLEALNRLNPNLPLLMSPFFSPYHNASPAEIEAQYRYLLENVAFRKGDILCPQDSYGAFDFDLKYVEEGLSAIQKVCREDGRLSFWVNCENFGKDLVAGDISRFITQLHLGAEYGEKLITFSYSHYYNPATAEGRANHEAYLKYASRFSCWDTVK